MDNTQRKELIEEYRNGVAKYKLATKYHCSKQTVDTIVKQAVKDGVLEERILAKRMERSERFKLESQVRYALVCDYYNKGYDNKSIKEATGMCFGTIHKYIELALERGDIQSKDSIERKLAVQARRRLKQGGEVKERTMCYHYAKPTLNESETIKCTYRVSCDCVYGRRNSSEQSCRYSLVTGKCRTIGPNGEKINPLVACGCYSRKSKNNPKLNNAVEE